jgi:hypothetical protein
MMAEGDPARLERVWQKLLQMKKIDIATLQQTYDGN